jgi:hypothetical protein
MAANRAHDEAILADAEDHSAEYVKIKKEQAEVLKQIAATDHEELKQALQERYEELQVLEEEQKALEDEQRIMLQEEFLANNEEFQALTEEQKIAFRIRNEQALQDSILSEKSARELAAKQTLEEQIKTHNTFLMNQQKFGTAYATLSKIMHSEVYKGAKQSFSELEELTASHSATLKAIGKAAAISMTIIRTYESAMSVYAGFATIPIIGHALGIAAAAATIAFGFEKVRNITAAADGGLLTGGMMGKDSIPVLGMPGELIVPTRNFDEVVGAVADKRNNVNASPTPAAQTQNDQMMQQMSDTLKSIDQKFTAPTQNIFQGDVMTDDIYIDAFIRKVSDAIEFRNARLIVSPAGT